MKDQDSTAGFSFQLSESTPPAEVLPRSPFESPDLPPVGVPVSDTTMPVSDTTDPTPTRPLGPVRGIEPDDASGVPPLPPIKHIAFPRPAPTFFAESVSRTPPVSLRAEDEHEDGGFVPPDDLPLATGSSEAPTLTPQERATKCLFFAANQFGSWARQAGRWTLEASRSGYQRAFPKLQKLRLGRIRRPQDSAAFEEVPPLVEATARSVSLRSKLRPFLPGGVALVAAAVCYLAVSRVLPSALEKTQVGEAAEAPTNEAEVSSTQITPAAGPDSASESPDAGPARASEEAGTPEQSAQVEQLALPVGMGWPGKGLIEVVTGGRELIYVDGVFTGRGPLRRIPVAPGKHEIILRTETSQRVQTTEVVVDRRTRLVFEGADTTDAP